MLAQVPPRRSPVGYVVALGLGAALGFRVAQAVPRGGAASASGSAADLLGAACEAGKAAACGDLGKLYALGVGVPRDLGRAADLFDKACSGGDTAGCASLGEALDVGQGRARDATRTGTRARGGATPGARDEIC